MADRLRDIARHYVIWHSMYTHINCDPIHDIGIVASFIADNIHLLIMQDEISAQTNLISKLSITRTIYILPHSSTELV